MDVWINELLEIWIYGFLPSSVGLALFTLEILLGTEN